MSCKFVAKKKINSIIVYFKKKLAQFKLKKNEMRKFIHF